MKSLIVVDMEYDFFPVSDKEKVEKGGGALAVPNAEEIIPIVNKLLPKYDLVIFTKDWHPEGMKAFASSHENKQPFDKYTLPNGNEDTLWPDHCIQNTRGAELHEDIDIDSIKNSFYIYKKGLDKDKHPYSGFDGTDLADFLRSRGVSDIHVCGLAADFCVKETAIDGSHEGFKTIFINDATKPINPDMSDTYKELYDANVEVVDSWNLSLYNTVSTR